MVRIEKLNKIQEEAINALQENNFIGTLLMSQRTGKFITSFKVIYRMEQLGLIKKGSKIRYRGETLARKKSLFEDERKACIKILGKDIFSDFDISFLTYQSGLADPVEVEIFDEIDWGLAATMGKVIKFSKATYKIGLTGTLQAESSVFRDQLDAEVLNAVRQGEKKTKQGLVTKNINKGELLQVLLPIVYKYPYWKALSEGIVSPFETYIISHNLGTKHKYLSISKKYTTLVNERKFWDYCHGKTKQYYLPYYIKTMYAKKCTDLLYYHMDSKRKLTKLLLPKLDKTVLFSVGKKLFEGVTENIVSPKNVGSLIDQFREGKINDLASSKMIGRGISLPELNNCIFMSYYGKSTPFLQRLARISTFKEGKISKVFFIVTNGTYEEKWLKNLTQIYDEKGKLIHSFDLNIKDFIDSRAIPTYDF